MNELTTTSISYEKDGVTHVVPFQHPPIDPRRKDAIDYFSGNGCEFWVNLAAVPLYVRRLDIEVQKAIFDRHLEMLNLESLRIPNTATIQSEKLEFLTYVPELGRLKIFCRGIKPEDMHFLGALKRLYVLTLCGNEFGDDHIRHLPSLPNIEYIDLQLAGVTASAAEKLQENNPTATVYYREMKYERTTKKGYPEPSSEQSRQWREWPWFRNPNNK